MTDDMGLFGDVVGEVKESIVRCVSKDTSKVRGYVENVCVL